MTAQTNARRIQQLSRDCASSIYGATAPTPRYAEITARLMFMTAAHESGGWRWRRQLGFGRLDTRGAFGLWQVERQSIEHSIRYIRHPRRGELYGRCVTWLDQYDRDFPSLDLSEPSIIGICTVMQDKRGDPLACLFGRLHYLKFPAPVPATIPAMADYAKRYYNTHLGKATPQDYRTAFERWWPA